MRQGTKRTFSWATIEQPGDFYQVVGSHLIQDTSDGRAWWEILQDTSEGLYCRLERVTYEA